VLCPTVAQLFVLLDKKDPKYRSSDLRPQCPVLQYNVTNCERQTRWDWCWRRLWRECRLWRCCWTESWDSRRLSYTQSNTESESTQNKNQS